LPTDNEPASNPIPAAIIDPAAEKVTRSKHRWLIVEAIAYFIVISTIVMIYAYYTIAGDEHYYLLFHVLAELFSIVILGSMFIVGWNTRYIARNGYFLVIGVSSLFVAFLDLLHTLAFPGMGFFTDVSPATNLAPQIWIAARYFQAITIVISLLVIRKKVRSFAVITTTSIACALVILAIFTRVFPAAHDGTSLTPFKIASEYVIIVLFAIATLLTWKERAYFSKWPLRLVLAFLLFMIVSELLFTLYARAYEFTNMLGHLSKIVAFAFAYKAIVQTVLVKPLDGLFKKLVDTERDLERRNWELVKHTTSLQHEIAEREKAEGTLRQFILTISHEFRTPVTVLDQSVQNLVKYNERMSTEQETALTSAISRNMGIMTALVDNFSNLTRIDDHDVQLDIAPIDIKATIIDIVKAMDNAIHAKDMHVDLSIDDGIALSADAGKINHIARALVDNAVKFSPRGSTFSIIIRDHYTGEYNRDGHDGVLMQVADNGMGIDADLLPRLFERFVRSTRVQDIPGSGLGLAIAKEFVAMHGGKIYVATQVDKGTTISVFLPRRKP
jgi:signal transduction histidine kinase